MHAPGSLLFFLSAGGMFLLFGQTKPQPEKSEVACVATNHSSEVYNAQTKTSEEFEDWHVDCTIKRGEKVLYGPKPLVLPYPASYRDAMLAIDDFRKKRAPEILKEKEKRDK